MASKDPAVATREDHDQPDAESLSSTAAAAKKTCINAVLTDDILRVVLSKLETQGERDNYSLVCKRWLMIQSTERRRLAARAGPLMLGKIAARFTCLTELDFSQSTSRSFFPGVIDTDLQTIARNFHKLERINLQECKGITNLGVMALAKGIPGLRCVVLSGCRRVCDRGIEPIANSCSRLTMLQVAGCKLVTDKSLEVLSSNCKDLEILDMGGCINVTDQGLQFLARGCSKLQSLDISKCVKIGDHGLTSVASSCTGLRNINVLDCSKLTDSSIISVAHHCSSLDTLILGGCRNLTSASIQFVAEKLGQVLKNLQLNWCSEVADEALIAIFSSCDVIEKLEAQGIKITDLSLNALGGRSLRELRLNFCSEVSDAGVLKIATACPRLEVLELKQCIQVTGRAIDVVARSIPDCQIVSR